MMTLKKSLSLLTLCLFALALPLGNALGASFAETKALAEQDNSEARLRLAEMYEKGQGVRRDYEKAVEWYDRVHGSLFREAQRRIDDIVARLKQGAGQGDPEAQYFLGVMYYRGWGNLTKDRSKSFDLFQKAAEQGYAEAQFMLGHMYDLGTNVRPDYKKAFDLYMKAAAQGNADAMVGLGEMYEDGKGMRPDYGKARGWYEKAAALEDGDAQGSLGLMYEKGQVGQVDMDKARAWYKKGCANGSRFACNQCQRLGI